MQEYYANLTDNPVSRRANKNKTALELYHSFDLDKAEDGRFNCVNVTGVLGGPLLVEHSDYRYKYYEKKPPPAATSCCTVAV